MKILDKWLGKYSGTKRQQDISWLVLEGWEPVYLYVSRTAKIKYLKLGDKHISAEDTCVTEREHLWGPLIPASWDEYSNEDIDHFMMVAPWAKEKS